jgi:hypothetical protein
MRCGLAGWLAKLTQTRKAVCKQYYQHQAGVRGVAAREDDDVKHVCTRVHHAVALPACLPA